MRYCIFYAVSLYEFILLYTGISLQPYTELRNIYFKMQKKNENIQFYLFIFHEMVKVYFSFFNQV